MQLQHFTYTSMEHRIRVRGPAGGDLSPFLQLSSHDVKKGESRVGCWPPLRQGTRAVTCLGTASACSQFTPICMGLELMERQEA